jgi:hypothetical protein
VKAKRPTSFTLKIPPLERHQSTAYGSVSQHRQLPGKVPIGTGTDRQGALSAVIFTQACQNKKADLIRPI